MGPRALFGMSRDTLDTRWYRAPGSTVMDPAAIRALAERALDAARSAGAQYADVRFTVTRRERCTELAVAELEHVAFGVRALRDNVWGFVASPYCTPEEAVRVGGQAAKQAALNQWGLGVPMAWGSAPPAASGTWATPVTRDTFDVSVEEKLDLINGYTTYAQRYPGGHLAAEVWFQRQQQTFASTDGAFYAQTLHTAFWGESGFRLDANHRVTGERIAYGIDTLSTMSGGYEALAKAPMMDLIDRAYEDALQVTRTKPVDLGRFDVVFDAYTAASIVGESIGEALEIDRARGYEANAGGTSYLASVTETVGSRRLSTKPLTVRGDRSSQSGAATVKWDADGVVPNDFDLVRDGLVVDYATSREHASVMADWYRRSGRPAGSHGCSVADLATHMPVVTTPNLTVAPGAGTASFDDLIADTIDGYAVINGSADMDQQKLTGQGSGPMVWRIKRGKRVHTVADMGFLFRSPELWKGLIALGGAGSEATKGFMPRKGQPSQLYQYSVTAVPMKVTGLPVVDLRRKLDVK
jgi:TldD protein